MIALVQRVCEAEVSVGDETVGAIEAGILALIGVERGDDERAAERLVERVLGYRIFPDADGRMNLCLADTGGALLAVLALAAAPCAAHVPSMQECREGSEFILHAAQARDAGATRALFIGRLHDDLVAIRAFPRSLRWFAQDSDDEALLTGAAEDVFDAPLRPELHESAFLAQCLRRIEAAGRWAGPSRSAWSAAPGRWSRA